MSLPIDVIHCYDSNGVVSRIDSTDETGVLNEPEVSSEESFMLPTLPPSELPTPVRQHGPNVTLPEPLLDSDEHDAVQVEMSSVQESGVVHPTNTEKCVHMGVSELSPDPHTSSQFFV